MSPILTSFFSLVGAFVLPLCVSASLSLRGTIYYFKEGGREEKARDFSELQLSRMVDAFALRRRLMSAYYTKKEPHRGRYYCTRGEQKKR